MAFGGITLKKGVVNAGLPVGVLLSLGKLPPAHSAAAWGLTNDPWRQQLGSKSTAWEQAHSPGGSVSTPQHVTPRCGKLSHMEMVGRVSR